MVVPSIENTFLSFLAGDNLKVVYDVFVMIVLDARLSFSRGGSEIITLSHYFFNFNSAYYYFYFFFLFSVNVRPNLKNSIFL